MPAVNYLLTEEQLLCPICLDVFIEPATLPCGHNFCKTCITQHLNFNSQRQCPMCKERVDRKYKLVVNTFISEVTVQFKESAGKTVSNSREQHVDRSGGISSDVPAGPKAIGRKSYILFALVLTCLVYLSTNLKIHQILSNLNVHQLFDSVTKASGIMCSTHDRPLELFCKNEQVPICQSCSDSSHRFHHIVSLQEEYKGKKSELEETETRLLQMIQERQVKIQEIKHSVKLSKEAAERETAHGAQVFTALIQSMKIAQVDLFGMIEERQKTTEKQAQGFLQDLEKETSELVRKLAEVEQLSRSKNHLHFFQNFRSLQASPPTKDWSEVSICPALYEGVMRSVMVRTVKEMTETISREMKQLQEAELEKVRQNAVDVTLDPGSAHPALILSDDGKQVYCGDVWKKPPDHTAEPPAEPAISVLGKQSFCCGSFHYDVEVKGKTAWTLGVTQQSGNTKGEIQLSPENGFWTLCLRNGQMYVALASHPVPISVNHQPEKVKVFVDYDEGLVSFYDVAAAALLYSYTGCSFTEKLYPFFSPGSSDSAPLVISPVNQYRVQLA